MIDALYKTHMDRFWDHVGRGAARLHLTANGATWLSFVLCLANAAAFLWHRNLLVLGLLMALFELLDNVDGAIARVTNSSSRAGAFLDAATDRYKEGAALMVVAHVTGYWLPAMLGLWGGMLVSYNLARAKSEGGDIKGLPLFERMERIVILCAGLILTPLLPAITVLGADLLEAALWVLALGTHVTAAQRLWGGFAGLRGAPN